MTAALLLNMPMIRVLKLDASRNVDLSSLLDMMAIGFLLFVRRLVHIMKRLWPPTRACYGLKWQERSKECTVVCRVPGCMHPSCLRLYMTSHVKPPSSTPSRLKSRADQHIVYISLYKYIPVLYSAEVFAVCVAGPCLHDAGHTRLNWLGSHCSDHHSTPPFFPSSG